MNSSNQKLSPFTKKLVNNDSGIASKIQKINHLSNSDLSFNKENSKIESPKSAKKTSNIGFKPAENKTLEFSQTEMLNVAKKILSKRQQQQQSEPDSKHNNSVRAMKEKFENMVNHANEQSILNEEVHLTPRLLIKKFEAMSKDAGGVALNTPASKMGDIKTSGRVTSFLSNVDTAIQSSPQCNSTKIIDCSKSSIKQQLAPKYDIEFIDSSDTTQVTQSEINDSEDEDDIEDEETDEDDVEEELSSSGSDYEVEETYLHEQDTTLTPKAIVEKFESLNRKTSECRKSLSNRDSNDFGKSSLTYITSFTTTCSNSGEHYKQQDQIYENVSQKNDSTEPLYEELNSTGHSNIDEIYMKKQEIIKNFKIDYEEESDNDVEEGETSQNTSKFTQSTSELRSECSNSVVSRTESCDTISQCDRNSDTYSISSFGSEVNPDTAINKYEETDKLTDVGIYSIKDYRKQKRTGTAGKAVRKSILQNNMTTNSHDGADAKKKLNLIEDKRINNPAAISSTNSNESIMDRIKQLEEYIKHEDNIINQTGSALEQCFHDSQFTGSIEHIECNRLLLIACQKRQSYLTEINRLKMKMSTNKTNKVEETPEDLSGTLVFSDIQLPIKELYMNKLRNGDG